MKIWIVSFAVLFALFELYQWAKEFISPLPFYILGGVFLAASSNYDKGILSFWQQKSTALTPEETKDS